MPSRSAAPGAPAGWVRVDCHLHTVASGDAVLTLEQLAERAEQTGLDVVCITDHNVTAAAVAAAERDLGVRVIVGEEIRTRDGDVIGLFLTERIPYVLPLPEVVGRIRTQGGLVYAPHPFDQVRSSLGRVLPGLCADAAVDLDVLGGHVEVGFRGVRLHQRGQHRDLRRVLRHRGGRVADRRPERLDLEQQVGAAVLDRLEAADGPPELMPDLRVLHGHVQGPLRTAELLGGQRDRGHVEGAVQHRDGIAGRPDQGTGHPGELQPGQLPGLVQRGQRGPAEAGGVCFDREQRQPGVGGRDDEDQPGRPAVEHEALVPVQPPVPAVLHR